MEHHKGIASMNAYICSILDKHVPPLPESIKMPTTGIAGVPMERVDDLPPAAPVEEKPPQRGPWASTLTPEQHAARAAAYMERMRLQEEAEKRAHEEAGKPPMGEAASTGLEW